jgi:beta-galactosidase
LRTFAVDAASGFTLNGRHLPLHGVNLHQDHGEDGWAATDADHTQDLDMIREMGANAVRMAHYQHDQKDYDLTDAMGLVVWAEIPLVNTVGGTPAFTAGAERQLRELIRQNYNHPSIVFWGIGNEQAADNAATNLVLDRLAGLVKAEDPGRLSTYSDYAGCCPADSGPINGHTDVNGYNAYFGWYGGSTAGFGPWADALHKADPTRRIAISEYGAGAGVDQHSSSLARPVIDGRAHPEEYQASFHEQTWRQIEARPYLWGSFVWNMFDFASAGRDEGGRPGINDKGLVTRDRKIRKDAFYFYQANWSPTPTLYITSRRWTHRTEPVTELKVYSNSASVSATLNGLALPEGHPTDHVFRWPGITLRSGANVVTVTATIGGHPFTDTVTWTLT